MATDTAERVTFDQAYAQAKEATTAPPPPAPAEAVEPPAGDTNEAAEPKAEQPDKAPDQPPESAESEELLTSEEQAKLTADQRKTYKSMQKAYTQKTQKLSAKLKEVTELSDMAEYKPLITAFKANPQETLQRLASQYGFTLQATAQDSKAASTIEPAVQSAVEQMRKAFGPEGEPLADQLAPIMHELAKAVAQSVVDTQIKPIKAQQDEIAYKTVAAETEVEMKSFEKSHPDWKEHEPAMLKLSQTLVPATGADLSASDYLELLYTIATKDQRARNATTDVVKKLAAVVKASEPPDSGVKDQNITPAAPKRPTIEQAFEAAKKGIRW
jgi:hypothetical protein